ncbi:DUF4926 domain-containing protein [Leptolyngbya sp. PCC 6406]|uniref:DUF4926 domain-containing protein n=1 Tax=Leptolyngbya sp. PCC 6406 TaxID=1173264 RepID=UPI0002AC0E08|nr:DUF4926 domain-containing protein [Leptolyngbya sp. PCC 6406]
MTKPDLFDVVELTVDVPEHKLKAGDRGSIVEKYTDTAYEVEFANAYGETLVLTSFSTSQFIVVWRAETQSWVPLKDRIVAMIASFPEEKKEQVLRFTRSLFHLPV